MKKVFKISLSILMCFAILFSFSACSGSAELTEENVNATVETVEKALQEFDTKTLKKYVDSETLNYIINFAESHEQFQKLGVAIFKNMTMDVKSIDLEEKTVTVSVGNKDLYTVASNFTYELMNKYSTIQLLRLIDNDSFLDISLEELTENIDEAISDGTAIDITLTITQGKKNLVLSFDETAEDAVSGGALTAIKKVIGA
jgi:hypothetical protein